MSLRSGRALGISGWLVAATTVIVYLMASYDVTIRERGSNTATVAVAALPDVGTGELEPVPARPYRSLAAEAQHASGAELLAVDRRLEAAEREFPSDYRSTYERATLALYGRAEHHEAFYHLKKAAEKAIRAERAREMLDRLEQDGRPKGRMRRLAVGHREWTLLHEALEHGDEERLWQE